jgi:3-oxoacyl-[acyl-carrier-protein] synthase II
MTAAGEGAKVLWQASLDKRSGIDHVQFDDHSNGWKPFGGMIPNFNPEKFILQRKALKVMARDIQLAVAAATLAMEDAHAKTAEVSRSRFGVIVGAGVLNHELDELYSSVSESMDEDGALDLKKFGSDGLRALFPLWLLKYLPNMPACHISILFDLQGPNNTITTGASAGLQAAGEAFHIIQRGSADMMLAGGAESKLNPVGLAQYKILGHLAESTDPKNACQPFQDKSSGLVIGEGSGFLVLEELEHAKKRGARIYGEITGFGSSSSRGQEIAMKAALTEAGIAAKELDYLQATGLGVPSEDKIEAEAIETVFQSTNPDLCVSVSKPITGFTGFSAGALDLVISTMAMHEQKVAPAIHAANTHCRYGFKLVTGHAAEKKIKYAMTNAFGLNGQCVSLVMKAYS